MVPTFDAGRLPDQPTRPTEPQVELIILSAHKRLVKEANPIKHLTRPTPEIDRIYRSRVLRVMPPCPADRKRGLKRRGYRPPNVSRALRYPRSTHVVRARLLQNCYALADVIGGVLRMGVDADNNPTPCCTNSGVQTHWDTTAVIIYQTQTGMFCCEPCKNLSRSVVR